MQSHIETYGYGFRRKLCKNVSFWFIEKFMPRHHLFIEIHHRGLKRENAIGWCDINCNSYRPRDFLIEIQSHLPEDLYIKTLLHEFIHVKQWVFENLRERRGKMYWNTTEIADMLDINQPHEIEAYSMEEILYSEYMSS